MSIKILQKFSETLKQFLDELIEQFPQETDLVIVRVMVNDQIPVEDVMGEFIKRILPFQEHVKKRNERFFLEDMKLFEGVDGGTVVKFKRLWTSDNLDDEDKDIIWNWFDIFIKLMLSYKNSKKC
jgi:hypothetical protein